jgi:phospholipid transport system substrate-binding protein
MMRRPRFGLSRAIGVALLLFALVPAAPRTASAQDAAAFIQNIGTQAMQMLGPSVPEAAREARFRQIFEQDFDLLGAARFVLGPYARGLSPEQQEEFVQLFRESLARSYSRKLAQYAGSAFRVTGARPMGEETVVSSQIDHGGSPVTIDWHVVDHGGHFLITDVLVNGVSQKVTQRSEFAGIIQRNGGRPDALLAALRQELAQSGGAPRTGTSGPNQAAPRYGH